MTKSFPLDDSLSLDYVDSKADENRWCLARIRGDTTPIAEMLRNQFSETEPFVQFANQNQATVGSDVRSLSLKFS